MPGLFSGHSPVRHAVLLLTSALKLSRHQALPFAWQLASPSLIELSGVRLRWASVWSRWCHFTLRRRQLWWLQCSLSPATVAVGFPKVASTLNRPIDVLLAFLLLCMQWWSVINDKRIWRSSISNPLYGQWLLLSRSFQAPNGGLWRRASDQWQWFIVIWRLI